MYCLKKDVSKNSLHIIKTMKIKTLLMLWALFIAAYGALAQTRSVTEAMSIAESFLSNTAGTNLRSAVGDKTLTVAYTSKSRIQSMPETNNYYVFNRGDNNGFIIVSADERAIAILGYSNKGNFDYAELSPNLKAWLESYDEQIESLGNQSTTLSSVPLEQPEVTTRYAAELTLDFVTEWGQREPYNDKCPGSGNTKAMTGCGATAMAQIMYYHKFPKTGTGSHSYAPAATQYNYGTLTVNFGATTYDWANMLPTYTYMGEYTGTATTAQKNAVATLMYHCGVACDMSYGPRSSAVNTDKLMEGVKKHFNYSNGIELVTMSSVVKVSNDWYTWWDMLKTEIAANRPVLYGGGGFGGHIWVCYGYDRNNYFAMNWGNDGYADGYYSLSPLEYANYNTLQYMIRGIKPNSPVGNEEVKAQSALQAYTANGVLYISGLTAQQSFSVFSITGALVYQVDAAGETATVGLPGRGVYIVRSADKAAKAVN